MYTEEQRTELTTRLTAFLEKEEWAEAAVVTGSGGLIYRDLLSHTCVTIGVNEGISLPKAAEYLQEFCKEMNPDFYLNQNDGGDQLVMRIFWRSGLSLVLQIGPTKQVLAGINGPCRVLVDKVGIGDLSASKADHAKGNAAAQDSFDFYYAIRRCEMGLIREETIMAELQLATARKLLLDLELKWEGRKLPFMEYNELDPEFLADLKSTYAKSTERQDVKEAEEAMIRLYEKTLRKTGQETEQENLSCLYDYETEFAFR